MGLGPHIALGDVVQKETRQAKMPIFFSAELKKQFPNHVAGIIHITGFGGSADFSETIEKLYSQAREKLKERKETEMPEIIAWREVFSAMGLKPNKYRCAAEALLRRFGKEDTLPSIHPIVDLCNAFSLLFATPIAVYDVDQVEGSITVRHADGDEKYQTFEGDIEKPREG